MAEKEKKAAYSTVIKNGKKYIKIKRRAGYRVNDDGVRVPHYKDFYGATLKECKSKYRQYCKENALDEHTGLPDLTAKVVEKRTFQELLESWADNVFLKNPKVKLATKELYYRAYTHNLQQHPIMQKPIVTLIGSDLQAAYADLTCAASTQIALHKFLRLFFKHWHAQGGNDITIGVKVLAEPEHKRQDQSIDVLSKEEQAAILEAFKGHRLELLITLALKTGARISELLALTYDDITEDGVRITKQIDRDGQVTTTKTPASIRTIPITAKTFDLVRQHKLQHQKEMLQRNYRTNLVFSTNCGTVCCAQNLQKQLNKVYDSFGVRRVGFHVYRHTFGTDLAEAGVPIQTVAKLMGHTDISTTAKYYVNIGHGVMKQAIELIS